MADELPPTEPDTVRIVALICLTAVLIASIVCITITAVLTDRNVRLAEALTFGGAVFLSMLGGISFVGLRGLRRHRRWRLEREDEGP